MQNEKASSEYGCVRFGSSPVYKMATEAGNNVCMGADGTVYASAWVAAQETSRIYAESVVANNGGKMPPEYVILLRAVSQQTMLHALYVSAGRQVFQFGPDMISDFKRTDLSETPIGRLVLPYAAGFLHFGIQDDLTLDDYWRTEKEYVDGAYYHCGPEGQLTVQLTLSRKNGNASGLPAPFFTVKGDDLNVSAHELVDRFMDADITSLKHVSDSSGLHDEAEVWDGNARAVIHASLPLILNALFYLDAYGADRTGELPKSVPVALRTQYETALKSGKPKAIRNAKNALVGAGFTLVNFCGAPQLDDAELSPVAITKASVRVHWRRGHWRMQPCGEKLSMKKRIWVRPAIVGSKHVEGELAGHIYKV